MARTATRDLVEDVRAGLDGRTAGVGRPAEQEARPVPDGTAGREPDSRNLAAAIRACFGPANGVDPALPPRGPEREPPSFR